MASDLRHLFTVDQRVMCNTEIGLLWGTVKETYEDHIIVDIPEISDHMWYEEGWNLGEVYPEYNFEEEEYHEDDPYDQQYVSKYDIYKSSELF